MTFHYIDFVPILVPFDISELENSDPESLLRLTKRNKKKILRWYREWYPSGFEIYILPWNVYRARCLLSDLDIKPDIVCNPDKFRQYPIVIGKKKYYISCYQCSLDKPLPHPPMKCLIFRFLLWLLIW